MECVIVFEDYKTDVLSRLYTSIYDGSAEFIRFSGGNGKLTSEVERLLSYRSDIFVIVILDMVPENSDIVTIYNNLKMLGTVHSEFSGRYIIIPDICAEYRFIEAFQDLKLFQSQEDLELCLKKGDYKSSTVLNKHFPEESVYHKNFEKYCKFILKYTVRDCASSDSVENDLFQKFYLENCECKDCDISKDRLENKSCKYVNTLPFVSNLNLIEGIKLEGVITYKELHALHVKLVDEFNKWVDIYKTIYKRPGKRFRHITPMSDACVINIQGLNLRITIPEEE